MNFDHLDPASAAAAADAMMGDDDDEFDEEDDDEEDEDEYKFDPTVDFKTSAKAAAATAAAATGMAPPGPKPRKKHNRFNGMSEEEVAKRLLPDLITKGLDILIVSSERASISFQSFLSIPSVLTI